MLYEARSITPRQRAALAELQSEYDAPWSPVLDALHASGQLRADVKLARLLMFGALNWSAQWYDRRKGASLDELADAAIALFIAGPGGGVIPAPDQVRGCSTRDPCWRGSVDAGSQSGMTEPLSFDRRDLVSAHYQSVFAPGLFAGKVVVVTGGGSGIGRCIAHELAALGAHTVLIGRRLEKLHETAGEIVADGGRCQLPCLRHPRRRNGEEHGAGHHRGAWPHRRAGQQRRRPVHHAAGAHQRQGLGGGDQHQPHRRLPDGARVLSCNPCSSMAAPSSTSWPTCGVPCRTWATAARRGPAW